MWVGIFCVKLMRLQVVNAMKVVVQRVTAAKVTGMPTCNFLV